MTIPDIYIEELARAWASIDGKVKGFDRCKMNAEEDLIDGFYSGYIAEAHELLRLSPTVSGTLVVMPAAEPAGYASEYGLMTLAEKAHHYCLSISKKRENEFTQPLYTRPHHSDDECSRLANTILAIVGNVEHKGGGANAAKMYADMLNDVRATALAATHSGSARNTKGADHEA